MRARVLQAVGIARHLDGGGEGADVLVDRVFVAEVAMAGVHRHPEGIGVLLEQRLLAVAEPLRILRHVLRGDDEQRLFVGVRIGIAFAALVFDVWRRAQPLAGPCGHIAVLAGGPLRAHRRQVAVKLLEVFGGDLRPRCRGQCHAGQQQAAAQQSMCSGCHCSLAPRGMAGDARACGHRVVMGPRPGIVGTD
ncbi:hypothetical protein D9M70_514980 [compost metagenome]